MWLPRLPLASRGGFGDERFVERRNSLRAQKIISALPVPGVGQQQSRFDIGDGILCLMGISNIMRLAHAVD